MDTVENQPEPSVLSLPAVAEGNDYSCQVPGCWTLVQFAFSCKGQPFQVTILKSAH
jgi:hypothetical protein